MRRRVLCLLLCATLSIGLFSAAAFADEGTATVQAEMPEFEVNGSTVAFGGRIWWVIGTAENGVFPKEESATLFAKDAQDGEASVFRLAQKEDPGDGSMTFHKIPESPYSQGSYYANNPKGMTPWNSPNEYPGSTLQQKMEAIAASFPVEEQSVLNARTLEGGGTYLEPGPDGFAGPTIENQKVWSLSKDEYLTIKDPTVCSYDGTWWMRSAYEGKGGMSNTVLQIDGDGETPYYVNVDYVGDLARPALSLNLSSVLFASAADSTNGKLMAEVGDGLMKMFPPASDADHPIKFTMKNAAMALNVNATVEQSVQNGSELKFSYTDAASGVNRYISCILTDNMGTVKYYGKLADCSDSANGEISVPLSGIEDGEYTLQIFEEQANGEKYTDFCSSPVTMTVNVESGMGTVSDFSGTIIHTHNWSEEWRGDNTYHWHECIAAGCPVTQNAEKEGYGKHTSESTATSGTKVCQICGASYGNSGSDHLAVYRYQAIRKINSAVDLSSYDAEEQEQIKTILAEGERQIYRASSFGKIDGIVANVCGKLRDVLTSEEKAKLELKNGLQKTTIEMSSRLGDGYIRLDWKKTGEYDVDYYEVFRSTRKNDGYGEKAYFTTKQGGETGWYKNTKELKKGTRYYYKVRGVREIKNEKVYTKWSNTAYRTFQPIKMGVRSTTIKLSSILKKGCVQLNWKKSAGYRVDRYQIFRSLKKDSGYGTKPYFVTKEGGSTGWYENTKGLKKGNRYYYKVRGVRDFDGKRIYTRWSNFAFRTIR